MNYWERRKAARYSRRTMLRGGAALGVGVAGASLFAACGDDDDDDDGGNGGGGLATTAPSSPTAAGQPKTGGKLTIPWHTADAQLDPHSSTEHLSAELWRAASHGLLRQAHESLQPEADLATKWEQPDNLTYVFKLDPRAKWQNIAPLNGRKVTAEDVVFALERISTPGPDKPRASSFGAISSIEATDEETVTIKLGTPDVSILTPLSDKWTVIVAPEVVDKFGDLKRGDSIIGCGPFICSDADSSVGATLKRNPDYWGDAPYLDEARYTTILDVEARNAAFRAGEVDVYGGILGTLPDLTLDTFKTNDIVITDYIPEQMIICAIGGPTDKPPLNDERVRKAINLAIDRDALVQVVFPGAQYENTLVLASPYWGLTQEEVSKLGGYGDKDAEIKEAKALLEAAGATGQKIVINTSPQYAAHHITRAEAVQPMLKDIGLDSELNVLEFGVFKDVEAKRDFQMTIATYAAYGDPNTPLTNTFTSTGTRNYWKWNNPAYDAAAEKQRAETDPEARRQLVKDLQMMLKDGTPVAHDNWNIILHAGARKHVKNFRPNSSAFGWFLATTWVEA